MRFFAALCTIFLSLSLSADVTVHVTDEFGSPAAEAYVLVGSSPNQSLSANFGKTDAQGSVTLPIQSLTAESITVAKSFYPRITYFGINGADITVKLPPANPSSVVEVGGDMTAYPGSLGGSKVRFAVFAPYLTEEKLFRTEINDIMGSRMEPMSVMGKTVYVPTNFVLPKQTVRYGFIPIKLNKPNFSMRVGAPNNYHFLGLTGEIPIDALLAMPDGTIGSLQGAPSIDFNTAKIDGAGFLRNQNVTAAKSGLKVNLSNEKLLPCFKASSSGSPSGHDVFALSLGYDNQAASSPFFPAGIKTLENKTVDVNCAASSTSPTTLMFLAAKYDKQNGSYVMDPGVSVILARDLSKSTQTAEVKANNYYNIPQIQIDPSGKAITLTRPETAKAPQAQALYTVLASVRKSVQGSMTVEETRPQWVVFSPGTVSNVQLPELPQEMDLPTQYPWDQGAPGSRISKRWEAVWLGSDPSQIYSQERMRSEEMGYKMFEIMTHASRNGKDF